MIKLIVKGPVELSKALDRIDIDMRMIASLRLAQTVGSGAGLRLEETWKSLGGIEIEMLLGHNTLESQEVLYSPDLVGGIHNQSLATDEQQLRQRKVNQPTLQIPRIDANLDGPPVGVHQRVAAVDEGQVLEALHVRLLAGRLRIVRNGPRHRIPHHDQ